MGLASLFLEYTAGVIGKNCPGLVTVGGSVVLDWWLISVGSYECNHSGGRG